tara:strand:+ start:401 stop:559 length:159 start_codon:yes stop_codon:yes gene_type:complete
MQLLLVLVALLMPEQMAQILFSVRLLLLVVVLLRVGMGLRVDQVAVLVQQLQ